MSVSKQDKYLAFLQSSNNFLLVKDTMGKAKPCTVPLPQKDFTYGKPLNLDREGVSALISVWTGHKASKFSQPDKDFKKLNALSVVEGACTASDQRKFRKGLEVRVQTGGNKRQMSVPDITFGDSARPSTPIKAVLGHFYGEQAAEEVRANYTPKTRSRVFSAKRSTLGFDKRNQCIRDTLRVEEKNLFKLKKFLSVQPRTSTRR